MKPGDRVSLIKCNDKNCEWSCEDLSTGGTVLIVKSANRELALILWDYQLGYDDRGKEVPNTKWWVTKSHLQLEVLEDLQPDLDLLR